VKKNATWSGGGKSKKGDENQLQKGEKLSMIVNGE
jgi:hypothetical protein